MAKKKPLKMGQWFKKNIEVETGYQEVSCKNCSTLFQGNYCPECGQSVKDYDKPFSFVFYNFMGDFFSFDVRFFKTFVALVSKPGFLTKEYFEGRRVKYAPPLRIFIFTSFLLFLFLQLYTNHGLRSVLDTDFSDQTSMILDSVAKATTDSLQVNLPKKPGSVLDEKGPVNIDLASFADLKDFRDGLNIFAAKLEDELEKTTDPEERQELRDLLQLCYSPEQAVARLLKYLSWAFFILLPVFALLLKLFYIRRKHNFMRHLVFSIHIHSFVFVTLTILTLLYYIFDGTPNFVSVIVILFIPSYFFLSLKIFLWAIIYEGFCKIFRYIIPI